MVGFYRLLYTRVPPHAAKPLSAVSIKRPQLKGLVWRPAPVSTPARSVAVRFCDQRCALFTSRLAGKAFTALYPTQWQHIIEANQRPPMWLRCNRTHHTDGWQLASRRHEGISHPDYPDAVRLETLGAYFTGFAEVVANRGHLCAGMCGFLALRTVTHFDGACAAVKLRIFSAAPKQTGVDDDEQRTPRLRQPKASWDESDSSSTGDGRYPAQ